MISKSRAFNDDWPDRPGSNDEPAYIISNDRLEEIRGQKMYPFYDKGGNDGNGDFQTNIRDTQPQLNKQLNFLLPFYGFGFNYTWLSLHGYMSFSETPLQFPEYPLYFPIRDWPRVDDPSFMGIFYSRCKIGQLNGNEVEEYARRRPGVYFRLERDLYSRTDQFGVEIRERAKWDIRESMVGTETFEPKHIVIATWKNVSFAGGIPSASRIVRFSFFIKVPFEIMSIFRPTLFNPSLSRMKSELTPFSFTSGWDGLHILKLVVILPKAKVVHQPLWVSMLAMVPILTNTSLILR